MPQFLLFTKVSHEDLHAFALFLSIVAQLRASHLPLFFATLVLERAGICTVHMSWDVQESNAPAFYEF